HTRGSARREGAPLLKLVRAALLLAALGQPCVAASRTVDLYLPDAPPLSLPGQDGTFGILGDVTLQAATRAGFDLHVVSLPWSRAQRTVQVGTDQLIIPLSRTPEREDAYTWIAPIMSMDRAFFSLDKRVDSFEQARATYARVAVGMGSAQEQKLRDEGFSDQQIYPVKIGENPAMLLLRGRVDAWFNGIPETRYIWPQVSDRVLQTSPALMTTDLYLACSKRCDRAIVQRMREAVEAMRDDGSLQRLRDHYLDRLHEPGAR
ncbi:substrate-binding periplasmic protein, partial [Pseudomonas sp.]|uniref:substrate-binding periplasmic protein n=1 Tax=Pseudomonas sp. TaxID=306 RepID=UPI003CC5D582